MSDKERSASGHSLQIQFKSNGIGHYTIGQWVTMSDNGWNYRQKFLLMSDKALVAITLQFQNQMPAFINNL